MEWDEAGFDDEASPPLLPPEDRLWRHPTELGAVSPDPGSRGAGGQPHLVTVVALTSCISILLTLGVVAVTRPFGGAGGRSNAKMASDGGLASVTDVADVTARLRPAIGKVRASTPEGGDRWGSGVIFRKDGMMLTTSHVVEGAEALQVGLDDGRDLSARLVGIDRETDIAVIDLEGDDFPTAKLATGRKTMKLGQRAMTIGAPPGPDDSGPVVRVTMVSAMGQEAGLDGRMLVDMIRLDTAIAPGCDGGALVDGNGMVVAIASNNVSDQEQAVGYATPIDVARSIADQILADGKVRRSWLGIEGATGEDGVVVGNVLTDSPAATAQIAAGDVITAIHGSRVKTMTALVVKLRALKPGTATTVVVERDGRPRTLTIELGERPG